MFPNLINSFRFGLERELVVHLGIGIHVAHVAVADQVHVTKFSNSTNVAVKPRGVTCVDLNFFKSELIFTIIILTVQNWCQIDSN